MFRIEGRNEVGVFRIEGRKKACVFRIEGRKKACVFRIKGRMGGLVPQANQRLISDQQVGRVYDRRSFSKGYVFYSRCCCSCEMYDERGYPKVLWTVDRQEYLRGKAEKNAFVSMV